VALDHALPLAVAGDFLAGQYAARAYEGLGALAAAIDLLHATGGVGELLRIGLAAHRAGDLETARRAYAAAWELDPRLATDRLALVLADLGRPEEVEQVFLSALEQVGRYDRRTPGWQRGLARLYAEQERWVEAVGAYEAALATAGYDPAFDVEPVYFEIAQAYQMSGQLDEAVRAIETAIALNPTGAAYLRAGQIYESAGNPAAALAAYRLALEAMPDNRAAVEAVERLGAGE
jgi:tetratricopeptide (TPR) repeat protein